MLAKRESNIKPSSDYLNNFEANDAEDNNNTSKVTQKIFWSAVRSRKGTDVQNSLNSFKNKSTISGNLSMLSAALAMSSS